MDIKDILVKCDHTLLRVDCTSRTEFDLATAYARRMFATSPNPSMRLDVQSLAMPIAGARLAGCVRADTRRAQRLLYLARTATPRAQETPTARPVPQTVNHAPEAKERGRWAEIGVSAHVSTDRLLARDSALFAPPLPQEPDGNAPFDEIMDWLAVMENLP